MYDRDEVKTFLAEHVARPASAGVILHNEAGEALVVKAHYKSYWSFPGGWIEHGQTPRQAALRELLEETGIPIAEEDLCFSFIVDRVSDIMQTYQFIFISSRPLQEIGDIKLEESEIDAYKFVSKEYVNAHANEFGGAVAIWASSSVEGYFEQTIT